MVTPSARSSHLLNQCGWHLNLPPKFFNLVDLVISSIIRLHVRRYFMFHLRNSHMLFRFSFPLALCVIRISCVWYCSWFLEGFGPSFEWFLGVFRIGLVMYVDVFGIGQPQSSLNAIQKIKINKFLMPELDSWRTYCRTMEKLLQFRFDLMV